MAKTKDINIDRFVKIFADIYGKLDEKRTVEQLWLQVVEESSSIAEAVREGEYPNLTMHIADMFCWFCGFINRIRNAQEEIFKITDDFSSIIWKKFPLTCPLCHSNPCQCLLKREEIQKRSSKEKNKIYEEVLEDANNNIENRFKGLNQLCNMFRRIYKPCYYVMTLEEITFHYMEEVGEVSEHLRKLAAFELGAKKGKKELETVKKDFQKEIADVFSWLCAIVIKLNNFIDDSQKILMTFGYQDSSNIEVSFVDIIKKYYFINSKWRCRTCKRTRCNIKEHTSYYQLEEL